MRSLRATALVGTVLAVMLAAASPAAANEVGSDCDASGMVVGATLFPLTGSPQNQLPISVTASGVATQWKVRSPGPDPHTEKLKVIRPEFGSKQVRVVAESGFENVADGHEAFGIRIPVQVGDRFGVTGNSGGGAIACIPGKAGDAAGAFFEETQPGSTHDFSEEDGVQAAVSVVIEPDRDGDGYGDETQDKCPQSAAYQGDCPTLSLDSFPIVLKRSVLLLVTAGESASVQVFGQVGWRPRHKGGALASKTTTKPGDHLTKGVIVGLDGGTTTVKPGEVTPFNVKLPKSVLRHLNQISPKRVVKGTITARTTDLAGRAVEHTITIRLHGRAPIRSAGAS